jgi:hypothetical protein
MAVVAPEGNSEPSGPPETSSRPFATSREKKSPALGSVLDDTDTVALATEPVDPCRPPDTDAAATAARAALETTSSR